MSFAFAQANLILLGWNIGKGKAKECYKPTHRAALISIGVSVSIEALLALLSPWFLRLFSQDNVLISTVQVLLWIDVALEVGRASNLVYGQGLKTSGDATFPAAIAAVFNLLLAAGGSFLLGQVCSLGVTGVFIALASDECVRAVMMFLRFRSGKWEKKALVKNENTGG